MSAPTDGLRLRTTVDLETVDEVFNTPTTISSLREHFQQTDDVEVIIADAGRCYECIMEDDYETRATVKATLNPGGRRSRATQIPDARRFLFEWWCAQGHRQTTNNVEIQPSPPPPPAKP
jgi:hypothetical protein